MKNILMITSDFQTTEWIEENLKQTHYQFHQFKDVLSARQAALDLKYHLIILDLTEQTLQGLQLLEEIKSRNVTTPVLALCTQKALENFIPHLKESASDFLLLPYSSLELNARIKTLLHRTGEKESLKLVSAGIELDLRSREAIREEHKIELQKNECELLELLMRNPGHVITKGEILKRIWDYNFDPQTNVVDVLVWRLRCKIDKHFTKKVIQTVRGVGYTFRLKEKESTDS